MRLLAIIALLLGPAGLAFGAPMTFKELEFLVRQQTPENEIVREVAQRRLVAPIDEQIAAALTRSGATAGLLARLREPAMLLTPEESRTEFQRQMAQEALARKGAVENAAAHRELEKRKQQFSATIGSIGATRQMLDGKLVRMVGDELKPFDVRELEKVRLYAFYYSAMWCGPCRKFTPELVAAYQRLKAKYPEFEVIFVSADRDEFNMREYMRTHKMPWPAVRLGAADAAIKNYSGNGIPWLVAVSDRGQPLTTNGVDKKYLAPSEVLRGIQYLLEQMERR